MHPVGAATTSYANDPILVGMDHNDPKSTHDQLLTAREVAAELSISTETVLRWVRRGDLPAFQLPGGAIRFRRDALDAWLATRATRVA